MPSIKFTVYANPLPKERPRLGARGNTYTPSKTRQYERMIAQLALIARVQSGLDPFTGDIALIAHFYRKDNRGCDLDNLLKAIKDAGNGVLWCDDKQIVMVHASMQRGVGKDARIEIEVMPVEEMSPCK